MSLIIPSQLASPGDVVKIGDVCYIVGGPVDTPPNTFGVDEVYSTCEECGSAAPDGSDAGSDGSEGGTVYTINDFYDGSPGSTDFWGDPVSSARYTEPASNGNYSISVTAGDELQVAPTDIGGGFVIGIGNGFDGDFSLTAKCRYTEATAFGEGRACGIQLAANAVDGPQNTYIGLYGNGPTTRELRSQGGSIAFAPTSFYLRIRRVGIDTFMEYSTDDLSYNLLSQYTASLGATFYLGLFGNHFGMEMTSFYDWIKVETSVNIE